MHGYTFSMLVSGTGRGRSILHVSINLLNKLPDLVIHTVCGASHMYIQSLINYTCCPLMCRMPSCLCLWGGHFKSVPYIVALYSQLCKHCMTGTAGFHCLPWSISGMLCDKGFTETIRLSTYDSDSILTMTTRLVHALLFVST